MSFNLRLEHLANFYLNSFKKIVKKDRGKGGKFCRFAMINLEGIIIDLECKIISCLSRVAWHVEKKVVEGAKETSPLRTREKRKKKGIPANGLSRRR